MGVKTEPHVVMFPWLAYGHILPYLELAKLLSTHGVRVSFMSTPLNLARLPDVPASLSHLLTFAELPPLAAVDGLPEGAEATSDVCLEQIPMLKKALDMMQPAFRDRVRNLQPDLIVFDFVQSWVPDTAHDLGVKCVYFNIFNASFTGYASAPVRVDQVLVSPQSLQDAPPGFPDAPTLRFLPFEARSFATLIFGKNPDDPDSRTDIDRFHTSLRGCDAFVIRTCPELEGPFLAYLEGTFQKRTIPIGLLPPLPASVPDMADTEPRCTWLDRFANPDRSKVLYVSFGSECVLSKEQIVELALGLEGSGVPFFWALRTPRALAGSGMKLTGFLPGGFLERVKERGLVWDGWVAQQRVLAHPGVAGFMTHSGWSSVIEGIFYGKVLIHLPMQIDQGLVARLVAGEKRSSVEVERDREDGSFTRAGVCRAVRLAVVAEEGKEIRERAAELRESLFGRPDVQERCAQGLLDFIRSIVEEDNSQ